MTTETAAFYDRYWAARDRTRAEPRSRERARTALDLLREAGISRGRILDIGCGPGWALEAFRDAGFDAVGVDASALAVEEARARGMDARLVDIEAAEAPLAGVGPIELFDVIVLLEVLEHLSDPLSVLARTRRLLPPGGRLVISLPNEISLPARLSILLGRLSFGGHDDPHLRHFDRRAARRLFEEAGLTVLAERPISIVPPRSRHLRALLSPAPRMLPGAFSIASVYLLRGTGHGN